MFYNRTMTRDLETAFRFDCTIELVDEDRKAGTATLKFTPDPRRYEWVEKDGERLLFDRYDGNMFTMNALEDLLTLRAPTYFQRPKIEKTELYVADRAEAIGSLLDGAAVPETYFDEPSNVLRNLPADWEYVFLVADVVGSTRLSFSLDRPDFVRVMRVLLAEMGAMVPLFNGHVLKPTGDGLIAFFPAPSFVRMNDMALDCALSLNWLVERGINPALQARGLPSVKIRVGIEAGTATAGPVGDPASKQVADLLGRVINIAAKLQAAAGPGEVFVGPMAARNLHISWREMLESVPTVVPGLSQAFKFVGRAPAA
jgi:class 3 adenylate cyclase